MVDIIPEGAYTPPAREQQEYVVADSDILRGLGTITQQRDPELKKLFATSLVNKWGREAVPHIVDIVANGSEVDISSVSTVLTQAATPENIVDFCRMTNLDPVIRSSDRSVNRTVFRMIEKYGDTMPEQDKAKATGYLWKSMNQLMQYREELAKNGEESQAMKVDWDIYATVSALIAVDFHELSLVRHLANDDSFDEDLQDNIAQFVEKLTHPDKPTAHSTELTSEQWKKDIARLVRRAAINRYLDGKSTLAEVKAQVRAFEKGTGANDVIDSLVTDEVVVDPKVGSVTQELSELITKQFPKVKALVLMGSAVHGGAAIRTLTESQGEKDLDWGIMTTESITKDELDEIIAFATNHLGPLATKVGLPETFHSCDSINPLAYRVPALESVDQFTQALETGDIDEKHVLLYLLPSFPAHVNEQQKGIIHETLDRLREKDPTRWEDITDRILESWKEVHNVKKKHFNIAPRARDKMLRRGVVRSSAKMMATPMVDFLKQQTVESRDSKDNSQDSIEDQQKAKIVEMVYEVDAYGKALTGRTPERIEQETGIPKEEIFPADKKILYVGDPWQRMGKEIDSQNLVIIDYEFGESASFITDNELFREGVEYKSEYLLEKIDRLLEDESLSPKDKQWVEGFKPLVTHAAELSTSVNNLTEYSQVAEAWQKAREYIEKTYKQQVEELEDEEQTEPGDPKNYADVLSITRTDAWYDCVYGERGFRDIPDWQNIILPKIEAKRKELEEKGSSQEMIEKDIKDWTKIWIDEIRLTKKPEKAHVVQAVFPQLPFKDASFDRFVASWSISAHVFGELDKEGFNVCWDEIDRVLKKDGEAYIFPLNYAYVDHQALVESLREMQEKTGLQCAMLDTYGDPTEYPGEAFTLRLQKPDNAFGNQNDHSAVSSATTTTEKDNEPL